MRTTLCFAHAYASAYAVSCVSKTTFFFLLSFCCFVGCVARRESSSPGVVSISATFAGNTPFFLPVLFPSQDLVCFSDERRATRWGSCLSTHSCYFMTCLSLGLIYWSVVDGDVDCQECHVECKFMSTWRVHFEDNRCYFCTSSRFIGSGLGGSSPHKHYKNGVNFKCFKNNSKNAFVCYKFKKSSRLLSSIIRRR